MRSASASRFVEGEGPSLDADHVGSASCRGSIPAATGEKFPRVFETVARVRQDLPRRDGADRVLRRAVDGRDLHGRRRGLVRSGGRAAVGLSRSAQAFAKLIDIVVEASIDYLDGQVRAGADVLQIFDSWAGSLPDDEFDAWVVAPTSES